MAEREWFGKDGSRRISSLGFLSRHGFDFFWLEFPRGWMGYFWVAGVLDGLERPSLIPIAYS